MQLSTIKVSNILSFPFVENLTTIEWVKFHNQEKWVINIMIWPNGSWKSNLLDIIQSVWKYWITINYTLEQKEHTFIITENNNTNHSLTKHRGEEEKKSHIYISLLLSQDDYNNLFFLIDNTTTINDIISTYSKQSIVFWNIKKEDLLAQSKIPLYLSLNEDNTFVLTHNENQTIQYIYQYLQNFELIQHCRTIYNSTAQQKRQPLRNTFALITSENNYNGNNIPKAIHLFCKKLYSLQDENNKNDTTLIEDFFLNATNHTLQTYTWLEIITHNNLSENNFLLKNKEGYSFHYEELSSGEQSFLILILLIYSHDLHNGFLIIDEPELHLHPQSQKLFLLLLEEMKQKKHMQCIISTHSPIMINEHNINHVFRCSKANGASTITSIQSRFWEDEATLLQMLKFDNIAKIFFVNTIILVEGETDMYFLSHYINYIKTLPEWKHRINNYEIITISWKGWVKRWKNFLKKFNNNVYYIGDRDNTIEYNILSKTTLDKIPHERFANNKGSKYGYIVSYLKEKQPDTYNRTIQWIRNLYKDSIFLLSQGDLEAYMGVQSKGLDDTVNFCLNEFPTRIKNDNFKEKKEELITILKHIFPI